MQGKESTTFGHWRTRCLERVGQEEEKYVYSYYSYCLYIRILVKKKEQKEFGFVRLKAC